MPDAALHVDDLACDRGGRRLFEHLSFTLSPGEALQVEGANGAGKSSLLRVLAGLLQPAAGCIDNPFDTAWLGHDNALKPGRRLRDELLHWAALDGATADAVDAALARFDLTPLADLPCLLLSSGQRRRAALARLLPGKAGLWLLDEPAVGLDMRSAARLAEVIAAHRQDGGLVVAVTHGDIGLERPQRLVLGG